MTSLKRTAGAATAWFAAPEIGPYDPIGSRRQNRVCGKQVPTRRKAVWTDAPSTDIYVHCTCIHEFDVICCDATIRDGAGVTCHDFVEAHGRRGYSLVCRARDRSI